MSATSLRLDLFTMFGGLLSFFVRSLASGYRYSTLNESLNERHILSVDRRYRIRCCCYRISCQIFETGFSWWTGRLITIGLQALRLVHVCSPCNSGCLYNHRSANGENSFVRPIASFFSTDPLRPSSVNYDSMSQKTFLMLSRIQLRMR